MLVRYYDFNHRGRTHNSYEQLKGNFMDTKNELELMLVELRKLAVTTF